MNTNKNIKLLICLGAVFLLGIILVIFQVNKSDQGIKDANVDSDPSNQNLTTTYTEKSEPRAVEGNKASDYFALPISSTTHTVILETPSLSFELPEGYHAFYTEGSEGGYGADIKIGKKDNEYQSRNIALSIHLHTTNATRLWIGNQRLSPAEYVEYSYKKGEADTREYVSLFGNKAVLLTEKNPVNDIEGFDVIGYYTPSTIPSSSGPEKDILITISGGLGPKDTKQYQQLINTILSTLRTF